jgi:hypothetical protein
VDLVPRILHPDVKGAWNWEGNVQRAIADFLDTQDWTDITVMDTEGQERGVDIEAHKGDRTLLVEVKGYPSTVYAAGPKAGLAKPTDPALQARHWFSHAALTAMQLRRPNAEVAIGLPRARRYESLIDVTRDSLWTLGIGVVLVDEDGAVSWAIRPAVAPVDVSGVPDSTLTAEIVSGDGSVSGTLSWKGGRRVSLGSADLIVTDQFPVLQPGNPEHRLRESDGEAFVVPVAFSFHGSYTGARLVDDAGRVLTRDEAFQAARRVGFSV